MSQFLDRVVSRTSSPIREAATEANTYAVTAVHAGSVAAAAGLKTGLLYRPSNAAILSPLALPERSHQGEVRSRFVDVAADEEIELVTSGFPFGVEMAKSPTSLARDVLGGEFDVDCLAGLLHAGDSDAIGQFMRAVAGVQSGKNKGLGDIFKGWLGKTTGNGNAGSVDLDPHSYMGLLPHMKLAAAFWLAAHRNVPGTRQLLQAWEAWGVAGSGGEYQAIYHLAQALVREAEGAGVSEVLDVIRAAHELAEDSPLIAALWRQRSGEPLAKRVTLVGQRFPRDYRLPASDPIAPGSNAGANFVSLSETCDGLKPDQRLLVLMLGPYRANGFYSRILYRFQELNPVLGSSYPQVHVVTAFRPGGRHNPQWLVGEAMARGRGAKITILHDLDGMTGRSLQLDRSPHGYVVDRERIVRYDGFMPDEGSFWQGLQPSATS